MKIEKLYKSGEFTLYNIDITGKKKTASTLYFQGNLSKCRNLNEIRAVESGVVTFAGRDNNRDHRANRLKTHVTIRGNNGVAVTYAHLMQVIVRNCVYVKAGEVIGYTDSSLRMIVQCRSNGRFIDACTYFGIPNEPTYFNAKNKTDRDIVCERFNLTDPMRRYIDNYFNADELWARLARDIGE